MQLKMNLSIAVWFLIDKLQLVLSMWLHFKCYLWNKFYICTNQKESIKTMQSLPLTPCHLTLVLTSMGASKSPSL